MTKNKVDRHRIELKTRDDVITQLNMLLDNNYNVAIQKNDNLLGCVTYTVIYEKQKIGDVAR
jgi:hypothetical protein